MKLGYIQIIKYEYIYKNPFYTHKLFSENKGKHKLPIETALRVAHSKLQVMFSKYTHNLKDFPSIQSLFLETFGTNYFFVPSL